MDILEELRHYDRLSFELAQRAADEIESLRARCLGYEDKIGNLEFLVKIRNDRLLAIEAAAKNLLAVKGRHHTVEAYLRLEEACK